jgi:hemerythrin superfamily protein
MEYYSSRLRQFLVFLHDHSVNEEELLFTNWMKDMDKRRNIEALRRAFEIIEEYGVDRYLEVTKLTHESYNSIKRIIEK